uniref:Uncharacterized protein n=1 Tax=Haemonchus contortus TaxID=6289 RepID=A0A7I4Z5V4_HAECO
MECRVMLRRCTSKWYQSSDESLRQFSSTKVLKYTIISHFFLNSSSGIKVLWSV